MNKIENIEISNLLLDLDNPRFNREVSNQREAINLMLDLQSEKIFNLAKDIIENGLDPSENMIVRPCTEEGKENFYIILEGNRRATALKLLEQPTIAEKETIQKKFLKLEKIARVENLQNIRCVVIENEEEYNHWISLKHTGDNKGVGRERWTTPEIDRYNAKHGKTSIQSQIYKFILDHHDYYKHILEYKKYIYVTNLSRLFDKNTQKKFGLSLVNSFLYSTLPYEAFLAKLNLILSEMVYISQGNNKPDFNVSRIYNVSDREEFLNQIGIGNPEIEVKAWKLDDAFKNREELRNDNGFQSETKNDTGDKENNNDNSKPNNSSRNNDYEHNEDSGKRKRTNTNKDNTARNSLIPISTKFSFRGNKKCSAIFQELKNKMTHDVHPYSIAVMLRVFIDLSVSEFIEEKQIKPKDQTRNPGLYDKVEMCSAYLKEKNLLSQTKISAINAFAKDKLKASGTLQQYVHNQHLLPSKDILNREWDNFEPLLKAIWSE
jgi:hypothetical protein